VYHPGREFMTEYRLKSLLELREHEEDERRRELGEAQARLAAARERADRANRRLVEARAAWRAARTRLGELQAAGARAAELGAGERWVQRLRADEDRRLHEVRAIEASLAEADRDAEAAKEALSAGHRAHEATRRHEEEWRRSRRKLAERKDEV
jgi:hypothetical protein